MVPVAIQSCSNSLKLDIALYMTAKGKRKWGTYQKRKGQLLERKMALVKIKVEFSHLGRHSLEIQSGQGEICNY